MSTRLNKLLANRGIGARRKCDTIIAEGRVRVNGRLVSEPGTTVDEQRDRIEVDGRPLPKPQKLAYFVINKPVGVITTLDDPQGRPTIAQLLPRGQRLYPVGRLDADTSGLLLLTNDGDLAHKLMHPRYGVEKVYRVRLDREPGNRQLERLASGVEFEPGVVSAPARVRRIDPGFDAIMIEIIIHEGRFRQVRRMCEAVGLMVTGLHRVGYGPIRMGPLARGMWRELSESELERLRAAAARPVRRDAPGRPARPAKPSRPAPPKAAGRGPARRDEAEVEVEDTWIPGGGFAPGPDEGGEGAEWPARSGRARGDESFRAGGGEPRRRDAQPPWHAPEYRRGPAAAPRRDERAPRPEGRPARGDERRPPRRDESSVRGTARPMRRDERPARAEGRPMRRDERPARGPARPMRRDERPARAEGRPMRRDERPARGPARPTRRDDRPTRGPARSDGRPVRRDTRPGEPVRGRREDARSGPARGERGRPAGRDQRRGPSSAPREDRFGPPRRGQSRAFSPRPGRDAGPARASDRRGRAEKSAGPRGRRPESGQRRPRNR